MRRLPEGTAGSVFLPHIGDEFLVLRQGRGDEWHEPPKRTRASLPLETCSPGPLCPGAQPESCGLPSGFLLGLANAKH